MAIDRTFVDHNRAVHDQRSLETRAAHVHHDAFRLLVRVRIHETGSGTTRRSRQQGERGIAPSHLGRHHAAVGLHNEQQPAESVFLQAPGQLFEVVIQYRTDVGIEGRGADTFVKTNRGQQICRNGQVRIRQCAAYPFSRFLFLFRVGEGIHEANRNRLDIFVFEQFDCFVDVFELQRLYFTAVAQQSPADADSQVTRYQRFHIRVTVVVLFLANAAPHLEGIAYAFGGDQARLGASASQSRIRRYGGAVNNRVHRSQ